MSDSKALRIVAVLFLLTGISACIEFVLSFGQNRIFVPWGVLGFFIYPSLLAYRRSWRTVALVLLWIALILIPLGPIIAIFTGASTYIEFLGFRILQVPLLVFLVWTAILWLFNFWQYRVLIRPSIRMRFFSITHPAPLKSPFAITLVIGGALFALLLPLSLVAINRRVHLSIFPRSFGRQSHGMGYAFGLYHSEDNKAYEQTKADFANWIMACGFSPSQSPGGMTAWSGAHSDGDTQQWYQLPVGDNLLRLRITTNPKNENSIEADMNDDGYYTSAELDEMRHRELTLWYEMITWFETNSKANTLPETPGMKDWYTNGRTNIAKSYAKLN